MSMYDNLRKHFKNTPREEYKHYNDIFLIYER